MRISQRIALYFSSVTVAVVGIAFFFIYTVFAEYREEEFQRRLQEKMTTTIQFLSDVRASDRDVFEAIDQLNINNLFQEKILLFDADKKLVYTGIDDTPILFSARILNELSPTNPWIETREEGFDVVGVYLQFEGKAYYGINKAYDTFGHSKLAYLKKVLIITFITFVLLIVAITYFLSVQISKPLVDMAARMAGLDLGAQGTPLPITGSNFEVDQLAAQFNSLMERMNSAFAFQRHAVHHISHELRTPVAIMVSNLDRMQRETDPERLRAMVAEQREDAKSLGDIIHALLEIAKAESGQRLELQHVRVDELLLDIIDSLHILHPDFRFSMSFGGRPDHETDLTILANQRLLHSALLNLALNCVHHSHALEADIIITPQHDRLCIEFRNQGKVISEAERPLMFMHFFRGANSQGVRGFGLGLVFVHRIVQLHGGTVSYSSPDSTTNIFSVTLLLS